MALSFPAGDRKYPVYRHALLLGALFLPLYVASRYHYLLFHTIAELLGIGVALGIFFIAWNSRERVDNHSFLFIGICQFFIAMVGLLHTLAYKGMNVFPGYDANLPTQLWILDGYLQCLTFLAAPYFWKRRLAVENFFPLAGVAVAGTVALIFAGWFPDCFVEGTGLTPFKQVSEIAICVGMMAAMVPIGGNPYKLDPFLHSNLTAALFFNVLSRIPFVFYVSVYGLSNLVGHCLYLVYIYFLYRVILETAITRPHELLFSTLNRQKEELEQWSRVLERKVAERTRELEEMNCSLSRTNQEMEDLNFIVSHDLREPLRGINNFANLLHDEYGSGMDEEGRCMLTTLTSLARRQEELIVSLLSYSRESRRELQFVKVDVNEVVREVLDSLEFSLLQKGVDVRIPAPLPTVVFDRAQLHIIFSNLIGNAVKYNDTPQAWIEIGHLPDQHGEGVLLFVRDNGIGIAEKHQEKIFTLFKRLHGKDAFGGGTGTGLAIVKKIIERHHGTIRVESKIGEGATFYVFFPQQRNGS